METNENVTVRRDPSPGSWDTRDGRLARFGIELRRADDGAWSLSLPRPRALGPGTSLRSANEGAEPPADFTEILWPLLDGRRLHPDVASPPHALTEPDRHIGRLLGRAGDDVVRAIPWVRTGDADPAHVRAARTAVRRLRTHIRSARDVMAEPPEAWAGLRTLNDHLRGVRDLDIAEQTLPRLHRLARGEPTIGRGNEALQELLLELRQDRRRHRNELWAELVHPRTADLVNAVTELRQIELRADAQASTDEELARVTLRTQVDVARNRARSAVDGDRGDLLALRTSLRRVRVIASAASGVLGDDARRLARRAVEVQDSLGELADLDKTERWLQTRDSGRHQAVARELAQVAGEEMAAMNGAWRPPWERFTRRRVLRWL